MAQVTKRERKCNLRFEPVIEKKKGKGNCSSRHKPVTQMIKQEEEVASDIITDSNDKIERKTVRRIELVTQIAKRERKLWFDITQ